MTSRNNKLIPIVIIFLGILGGYLYFIQLEDTTITTVVGGSLSAESGLDKLDNLTIDFSPLDDQKFIELQVFGESPVAPGATGKKNIFNPI